MAIMLLGVAAPAMAQQIPGLVDLPASTAASNPDLAARRAALMQQRAALHDKIDGMNARCGAVEEGSAAEASCKSDQVALGTALNSHIQQSNEFNAAAQAAITASTSPGPAPLNETSVVDARNVPTGLPKSVEAEIPDTPAGNRVRKGFEAIVNRDWNAAHAWFQDALNHDPGNAGIQRLIDLSEYSMEREKRPALPGRPVADTSARDKAATVLLDRQFDKAMNDDDASRLLDKQMDNLMNADEARSIYDFNQYYLHNRLVSAENAKPAGSASNSPSAESQPENVKIKANWNAFFSALFVVPPRMSVYEVSGVKD